MNEQAEKLNSVLKKKNPAIFDMLSKYGKEIYFPKGGIPAQGAQAKDSKLNATIGVALEDDKSPMVLSDFVRQTNTGKISFLYAPNYGRGKLREIWLSEIRRKNPSIDAKNLLSLPIVTNGITNALHIAYKIFRNEENSIIMPELFWGNYNLIFEFADIKKFPLFVEDKETGSCSFNTQGLKNLLDEPGQKKLVLLNFPNNPTGYSPSEKEVDEIVSAIQDASKNKKIIILCDDAYFGLFFKDGIYKESVFAKLAGISDNVLAIKIDGITKEFFAWGLRVGFITYGTKGLDKESADVLEDKTAGTLRAINSNINHPSQEMTINAFEQDGMKKEHYEKNAVIQERFEEVEKVLEQNPKYKEEFVSLPFNSGYFMCIRLLNNDPEEIRKKLLKDYSTGVISLKPDIIRIAFSSIAKKEAKDLFDNIYNACKDI